MNILATLLVTTFIGLPVVPPPGAYNPTVTQQTIATTICVPRWTARVRPPTSYTTPLKRAMFRAQKLPGKIGDYELDHFIPLALGGAPRARENLWREPWPDARRKDILERRLQVDVCAGRRSLADARAAIRRY